MANLCWSRVLLGGLLAGVVINAFEFVLNSVFLMQDWADAMKALGKTDQAGGAAMVMFIVWGFLMGLMVAWLYAALRPRYGAGPRTAVLASLTCWILGYVMSSVPPIVMGLFPLRLMGIAIVVGLVEVVLAGQLAGWFYREQAAPQSASAAAAG